MGVYVIIITCTLGLDDLRAIIICTEKCHYYLNYKLFLLYKRT